MHNLGMNRAWAPATSLFVALLAFASIPSVGLLAAIQFSLLAVVFGVVGRRQSGDRRGLRVLAFLGLLGGSALVGTVAGGGLGIVWYELHKPEWGQYGYEFEGLIETLVGATLGLVTGLLAPTIGPAMVRPMRAGPPD